MLMNFPGSRMCFFSSSFSSFRNRFERLGSEVKGALVGFGGDSAPNVAVLMSVNEQTSSATVYQIL